MAGTVADVAAQLLVGLIQMTAQLTQGTDPGLGMLARGVGMLFQPFRHGADLLDADADFFQRGGRRAHCRVLFG